MKPLRPSAIALAFLALACANDPTAPAPARITALPRALTPSEQRIIDADNRLAIKLLKQLSAETSDTLPNLFISPLSVAMALAMTYNGAAGTTEEAMRATLELDSMSLAEVNEANRSLINLLRNLDPRVRFQLANSIWYRLGWVFEQPFLDATRTYYDARVEALDFALPAAPQTINDWVKQNTQGLIPEIVPSPIPRDVVMYLINAIYFKGDWTQQFDKERTAPRPFRLADGTSVDVPTMTYTDKGNIRRAATPTALVVDLPYGGAAFSMTIVLPPEGTTVDEVIGGLTLEQWHDWIAGLDSSRAELFLPKFKLENKFNLNATLKALGMEVAFTDVPQATRWFEQLQLRVDARYRKWWAGASVTLSSLIGNINVVTGPDDYTNGGPGPWVRLNEQSNYFGYLSNQARVEAKLSLGGLLPARLRGGAFVSLTSGDRFTPTLPISALLTELALAVPRASNPTVVDTIPFHPFLFRTVAGHRLFIQPRGRYRYDVRASLDLHLERGFARGTNEILLTLDAFNVLGDRSVTAIQTEVNALASTFGSDYGRVRARVAPRTLRLGAGVRF